MREIYLLSGLGADKRVFDFVDFSYVSVNHIEWIPPIHNESLASYSKRLSVQIKTNRPILLGVSFGGIVAVEIAKLIDTEKVILVSSAKNKFDIPFYFRIAGLLGLNKVVPKSIFKSTNLLTYWFFGTTTDQEKKLLKEIIKDTDGQFLYWAIDKIVNWKNTRVLANLIHIHGTDDKILPVRTCDFEVEKGGHLMIVNKGMEISEILKRILS